VLKTHGKPLVIPMAYAPRLQGHLRDATLTRIGLLVALGVLGAISPALGQETTVKCNTRSVAIYADGKREEFSDGDQYLEFDLKLKMVNYPGSPAAGQVITSVSPEVLNWGTPRTTDGYFNRISMFGTSVYHASDGKGSITTYYEHCSIAHPQF